MAKWDFPSFDAFLKDYGSGEEAQAWKEWSDRLKLFFVATDQANPNDPNIDLNKAYNQLELHPGSRHVTTFSTHLGLFRYRRLFVGLNSAAEVFQNTIAGLLRDIPNQINVADDILVYGKTQQEHD